MAFELPFASVLAAIGPLAHLVSAAYQGDSLLAVLGSTAAALAGLVVGLSRQQATRATEQRALMEIERERAQVEHERAELLAERNRLAREIHDVLAHTLGAVSVQLEALDAVVDNEDTTLIHDRVQATRGLVVQGLEDARRAVTALRDDAVPLPQQLKELCGTAGADLSLGGEQRPLSPPATLALFRIAQEGLTNAAKHAPGARVDITLRYGEDHVTLDVHNARSTDPPGPLAAQGGGYGLQGMRERVLLLGGTLDAGPGEDGGWLVRAAVPA
jgi:signal transduction histidine kinase